MGGHTARLSSSEIGGIFANYIQESLSVCLYTYFLYHIRDEDIKALLQKAMNISEANLNTITTMLTSEGIPIPDGFTEKDLNLSAPPLFYDPFALSFVYSKSRLEMINNSFITANVARPDMLEFLVTALNAAAKLYESSTTLMLSKGIYDRPPMIPYPKEVEYIEKVSYIKGFGKKRPLNAAELTEIFFNTERNYFSVILCIGLLQVVKDKEIHKYILEGKQISESQIQTFNDILIKEQLLGNVPMNMEVTDSTESPFSDRLIVTLFHSLNAIDITLLGHALSLSLRTDLAVHYQKYLLEIALYAEKGFNIMVDRGWMQKPPHAPSRRELQGLD